MRLDREFRTFVVRDRVVAITQYSEYCPAWADQHQLIADKIHHLFVHQGVRDKVPRAYREWAYVANFVLLGEPEEGADLRVQLVEINPFGPGTSASLFDWRTERHLLQAGHDLWGDLGSTAAGQPSDIDAWTKTVACRVGDGDDEQTDGGGADGDAPQSSRRLLVPVVVRCIDLLGARSRRSQTQMKKETAMTMKATTTMMMKNQEAIDEFVDGFAAQAILRPVVPEHCAGRFVRRRTPEFVAGAVASVQADPAALAWLRCAAQARARLGRPRREGRGPRRQQQ